MGKERRMSERIESLINVRYKGRAHEIKGYSLTKDVSESGMGLPVNSKIPPGTTLDMDIILEQAARETLAVVAKVVWSRRNSEHWKPRYSAGLRFSEISENDKDSLIRYARDNRWVKGDFERSLEDNKVPVLDNRGEFLI